MTFGADIHGAHMMNPFALMKPTGLTFVSSSEMSRQLMDGLP